ncbi:hypothetical protein BDZ85DRAFT_40762 [Elsinoe ampelina]|uniref:Uncharacterized protein n=1 Tax=Elsinoe ampelina TaxID=302913 RepID=A0A6A6G2U3_9PEZI|nr:hypothetical protein BDZ85DRAFT_40762 [Elsinoe ampelina]
MSTHTRFTENDGQAYAYEFHDYTALGAPSGATWASQRAGLLEYERKKVLKEGWRAMYDWLVRTLADHEKQKRGDSLVIDHHVLLSLEEEALCRSRILHAAAKVAEQSAFNGGSIPTTDINKATGQMTIKSSLQPSKRSVALDQTSGSAGEHNITDAVLIESLNTQKARLKIHGFKEEISMQSSRIQHMLTVQRERHQSLFDVMIAALLAAFAAEQAGATFQKALSDWYIKEVQAAALSGQPCDGRKVAFHEEVRGKSGSANAGAKTGGEETDYLEDNGYYEALEDSREFETRITTMVNVPMNLPTRERRQQVLARIQQLFRSSTPAVEAPPPPPPPPEPTPQERYIARRKAWMEQHRRKPIDFDTPVKAEDRLPPRSPLNFKGGRHPIQDPWERFLWDNFDDITGGPIIKPHRTKEEIAEDIAGVKQAYYDSQAAHRFRMRHQFGL